MEGYTPSEENKPLEKHTQESHEPIVENIEGGLERESRKFEQNTQNINANLDKIEASSPARVEKIKEFINKNVGVITGVGMAGFISYVMGGAAAEQAGSANPEQVQAIITGLGVTFGGGMGRMMDWYVNMMKESRGENRKG
jgi:hypothetical protein